MDRMYYKDGDSNGVLNVIGPKLKKIRNDRNISQTQFSQMCGEKHLKRSVATISKIENQLRSVYDYEVQIFAEVLGIPIDELYTMDSSEEENVEIDFSVM